MNLYQQIFDDSQRWIAEKGVSTKDFFKHLSKGQYPDIWKSIREIYANQGPGKGWP